MNTGRNANNFNSCRNSEIHDVRSFPSRFKTSNFEAAGSMIRWVVPNRLSSPDLWENLIQINHNPFKDSEIGVGQSDNSPH